MKGMGLSLAAVSAELQWWLKQRTASKVQFESHGCVSSRLRADLAVKAHSKSGRGIKETEIAVSAAFQKNYLDDDR